MNSIFESKSDYLVVNKSDYVYCPVAGHYFYKNHLDSCEATHTVWA